jgi:hypothetical protein
VRHQVGGAPVRSTPYGPTRNIPTGMVWNQLACLRHSGAIGGFWSEPPKKTLNEHISARPWASTVCGRASPWGPLRVSQRVVRSVLPSNADGKVVHRATVAQFARKVMPSALELQRPRRVTPLSLEATRPALASRMRPETRQTSS